MAEAGLPPSAVGGVGFDATCSLVVLDAGANALTVSPSGEARRNVIVWMDHRAMTEARAVNDTQDDVLRYVGGSISPEMEIPKLLWLKRHLPSTYDGAGHFFDLADFLSFRATGSVARSMCTLTCKWNFLAHEGRWSRRYLDRVGLGDLALGDYARIGQQIAAPGTALGTGLSASAAQASRCWTIWSGASCRASPSLAMPRGWPTTSTCCPNFWAIAHPMPIRIHAPSSRASISTSISAPWNGCSSPACAAWPMAWRTSSTSSARTASRAS
jgi:hypothetical protein